MNKPPEFVQIGPFRYVVSMDETAALKCAHESNSNWVFGAVRHKDLEIVLAPDQAKGQLRDTLLHEVLHGIIYVTGGITEGEEKIVKQLTATLLDTLRRNPDLVWFLLSEDETA